MPYVSHVPAVPACLAVVPVQAIVSTVPRATLSVPMIPSVNRARQASSKPTQTSTIALLVQLGSFSQTPSSRFAATALPASILLLVVQLFAIAVQWPSSVGVPRQYAQCVNLASTKT